VTPLGQQDFESAYARVAPHIHHTPLLTTRMLSERSGFEVRLKAEMFQRGGSYKIRGPLNKLALLSDDEKRRGVVCSSAGNHAQGVALAARIHGIKAVVVMAENATPSKIAATRGYGAEVVLYGTIWDEANEKAKELVRERGLTYVHPFDDLQLIAGQGTLGLEIVRDWPDVEVVVVPIGGGGLISGVAAAIKQTRPDVRVIGVEPTGAASMKNSIDAGEVRTLDHVATIADGLMAVRPGNLNFAHVREFVDRLVTVEDDEIAAAVRWLFERAKVVAEPSGAATVAAALRADARYDPTIVAIVSGGNLDPADAPKYLIQS